MFVIHDVYITCTCLHCDRPIVSVFITTSKTSLTNNSDNNDSKFVAKRYLEGGRGRVGVKKLEDDQQLEKKGVHPILPTSPFCDTTDLELNNNKHARAHTHTH